MANVIDIGAFKASKELPPPGEKGIGLTGPVHCAACHHEWEAEKVPVPAWDVTCPKCGLHRGAFVYQLVLPEETSRLTCNTCDGQLYQITTAGTFCIGCGAHHSWDSIPSLA